MDDRIRQRIRIAFIVWALLFVAGMGLWLGRPAYENWQQERFLKQAQEFLTKTDYRNANLCVRKVLATNPANLKACRLMAQIAEQVKSPDHINWLQRVVDLEPGVLQNHLDLAKAAFAQGDAARAWKALESIDEAGRKTAAFHEMAALMAAAANQIGLSAAHFAEAANLDPENKLLQLNLAVLQMQATSQVVAAVARKNLETLSTNENLRLQALRILTAAALHTNDLVSALAHSSRLMDDPSATFDDRLLHLTILAKSKNSDLAGKLASAQEEALKKPDRIYDLAGWMIASGMTDDALKWVDGLPADLKLQWPAVMAKADALIAKKEWARLLALLDERKWGSFEFVRLGLLALVDSENRQVVAQQKHWLEAMEEAGHRLSALTALLQMARKWKWEDQKEDLLWRIIGRFPKETWTLKELNRSYAAAGNTRGLNKVYSTIMAYDPNDIGAKNDFAATSLLLKLNLPQAHGLAREAYDQRPQDPVPASTYAFSLYLQGRAAEGLKVLEKLTAQQLENPGIAAYYGLLLSASGEKSKARKYLDLATLTNLLPEEKALVQEALKGL